MKVIYYCYGGTHSSPIAAAIHLGKLSATRKPSHQELWDLPYFDKVESEDRGKVNLVGIDADGNEIYVCGRGNEKLGITQAIISGMELAGGNPGDVLFVDTWPAVNSLMRVGGYLSRQWKWISIGRPVVIYGSQMAFLHLVRIVEQTKNRLQSN